MKLLNNRCPAASSTFALRALLFVFCGSVHAQQPGKIFRIGFLDPSTASGMAVLVDAFRQELNKLGWIEGKNITIEHRFAEQKNERLPELAAELVRLKVDLIVTSGGPTPLAAKKATSTIPIVMTNSVDPVGQGLVASLARPGGNVTGNSGLSPELITKMLEILKDAVPRLSRVGLLRTAGVTQGFGVQLRGVLGDLQLKELRAAAVSRKLKWEENATQPDATGLESAFKTAKQKQVGAIMVNPVAALPPKENRSWSLPAIIGYRQFTFRRNMSMRAVSCPTASLSLTCFASPLTMSTKSSKAPSPPICPWSSRQNLNSSSISKPQSKSNSQFRRICWRERIR